MSSFLWPAGNWRGCGRSVVNKGATLRSVEDDGDRSGSVREVGHSAFRVSIFPSPECIHVAHDRADIGPDLHLCLAPVPWAILLRAEFECVGYLRLEHWRKEVEGCFLCPGFAFGVEWFPGKGERLRVDGYGRNMGDFGFA